jgi:hypothetical protein
MKRVRESFKENGVVIYFHRAMGPDSTRAKGHPYTRGTPVGLRWAETAAAAFGDGFWPAGAGQIARFFDNAGGRGQNGPAVSREDHSHLEAALVSRVLDARFSL